MDFWENVSNILKQSHLTQAYICERTNININTLHGWTSKKVLPRVDDAYKIAKALNTSVEYLMTGIQSDKNISIKNQINSIQKELNTALKKISNAKAQIELL